ncbi:nucleotide exchange factor GrpE [Nocardia sp. NEAU-G5]|uniref:Protein GrpE n=1 Tax=Nocardia albiluteola TaxID=2842303 RepID=A0ABS6B5Z9_9NOCA|nr:nucleotide exchange factor GrpE [Nocardia albiluteola]MBU3065749.1 nucleotide exchange factor GrpE [Nocardia albiluteola]
MNAEETAAESTDTGEHAEAAPPADEIAALRDELATTQDRYRRALADLDNYRKRTEREAERQAAAARNRMLHEWLDAVDSVERALQMEPGDPGLSAVLEQMNAILARNGVARIDAAGTRFDPQRHEAIAVVPVDDAADQLIAQVARSGYTNRDGEIIRPAQVVVGRRKTDGG